MDNPIATYTKLSNGEWGLKIVGTVTPGQSIGVRTRAGVTKRETIKGIVWSKNGITVCSIMPKRLVKEQCLCTEYGCCRPYCQCKRHCVCRGGNVFDCLG